MKAAPLDRNCPPFDLSETKAALLGMALEAAEMREALCGSVTDALAGWLATQYAQAAQVQLARLEGAERMKLLRTFAQDWALLRKGDQTAERLQIDRERLAMEERESLERFKTRTVVGLEALHTYVEKNPRAKAAFDALVDEVRHPFDARQQGPIETWGKPSAQPEGKAGNRPSAAPQSD